MRFETLPDGSLLAIVDRDARSKKGSGELSEQGWIPNHQDSGDRLLPSGRFSIHTTGIVHRYASGERKSTLQIEPLHSLTKVALIGFVSIPRVSRLDPLDATRHRYDICAPLEIPENVSERLTFLIQMAPKGTPPEPFGVALNYELYTAIIRLLPPQELPPQLREHFAQVPEHFICGVEIPPNFKLKPVDKATAELEFYQRIHGRAAFVFREDKRGAYVAMSVAPSKRPPKLTISFNRSDLRTEIIPFEAGKEPTHKIRFWICDKGGRNTTDDLRHHIISVVFDDRG